MAYRSTAFHPAFSLRREIDRLFDDAFGGASSQRATWMPPVDVRESARDLRFELELPGLTVDDVEVTADNGVLTVKGEKRGERTEGEEGTRWHYAERGFGPFQRSFQLPQGLDEGQISATFRDGVLTVTVPKSAIRSEKRIRIEVPDTPGAVGSSEELGSAEPTPTERPARDRTSPRTGEPAGTGA